MHVELRVREMVLAETTLGGPLLLIPEGTAAASRSESSIVLELAAEADGAPDLLVGSVPLVWWNPETRAADVSFLTVPPPRPFAADDIDAMWEQLHDSGLALAESVPLQGRGRGGARASGYPLVSEAVPRALSACRELLQRWPREEVRDLVWRPADMRGGREDLRATDAQAAKRPGVVAPSGVAVPDRIARRHRSSVEWRSERLAAVCRTLAERLREQDVASSEDRHLLTLPLDGVASRAASPHRSLGPPVSSWSNGPRSTFGAVLDACVGIAIAGKGERLVPLSHVWRLYECWLSVRVLAALEAILGAGESAPKGAGWIREWTQGTATVRLHAQATIGAAADPAVCGHPDGVRSVSSDLRPDVLVSAWGPAGKPALACIDAKRRVSRTAMDPSEVAAAASKYLWGIRSGDGPDPFPVESAIIVSSSPLPSMHDEGLARIATSFLLPSGGGEEFDALIAATLERLLAVADPG